MTTEVSDSGTRTCEHTWTQAHAQAGSFLCPEPSFVSGKHSPTWLAAGMGDVSSSGSHELS